MGSASNPRNDKPHLENGIVAHEIVHHYWGHLAPPATSEDFWMAESFAELFACMYVAAAFDARDCEVRMAAKRTKWEGYTLNVRPGSLSQAYASTTRSAIVYDYGTYVLGEMLIRRLGREPFFAALDVMMREHPDEPLTTERLQAYLEAASGTDLDAFFAFWIHQGRVPALSLEWALSGTTVRGTVESDVPFGAFDVPVRLSTKEATALVWVDVVDGKGTFAAQAPPGTALKVELDPEGYVLARQRRTVAQR
jgi:aminopeptidase N